MAYITETTNYDSNVYQIATTDSVVGGATGPINISLQNLANRTNYLKSISDQLKNGTLIPTGVAPLASPAFTGSPTAPTQAQFDNTTKLATTAFVQRALGSRAGSSGYSSATTLSATDWGKLIQLTGPSSFTLTLPATSGVPAGSTLYFQNGGKAVTLSPQSGSFWYEGSAPATFVIGEAETCDVMWDGAAFIVQRVSRGVTQAQFDNTTKLATTAFVQRALGNYRAVIGVTTTTTLTAATHAGALIADSTSGAASTFTLPLTSTMPTGSAISFMTANSNGCVVQVSSGDAIMVGGQTGGVTVTSLTLKVGDTLSLISNNAGQWVPVGGSAVLQYTGGFAATKAAASGYQKLPSGLIIQWGQQNCAQAANTTVTFPVSFPNAIFIASCCPNDGGLSLNYRYSIGSFSQNNILIASMANSSLVYLWFAIGY